jgi:hypothetical protein
MTQQPSARLRHQIPTPTNHLTWGNAFTRNQFSHHMTSMQIATGFPCNHKYFLFLWLGHVQKVRGDDSN